MYEVAVLMSTYNGEKYLREQVKSIFQQEQVKVSLYVRDDGSTDNTIKIINELQKEYDNIFLIKGENIGWRRSFRYLIDNVPTKYEYYAFSDQDDFWLKRKLIRAIELMGKSSEPTLYCSAQTMVDKGLNIIKKDVHMIPVNKFQGMTNIASRGCVEVFNTDLLYKLKEYAPKENFAHDRWVARVALYTGKVIFDKESYILYRQHEDNASGNNSHASFKEKCKNALGNYRQHDFYYWYAKELLEGYKEELGEKEKEWLSLMVSAKRNIGSKLKLLFSNNFVSETKFGTTLLQIIMILGLYQRKYKC